MRLFKIWTPGGFELLSPRVYLPLWGKTWAKLTTDIINDFHTSGGCSELHAKRVVMAINFYLDLVRYVYGRRVMAQVSVHAMCQRQRQFKCW